MKAIRMRVRGKFAFFKKPDVNKQVYFTYDHIHKVAVLGILGAILGKRGYRQREEGDVVPPFYTELKELQVSIVPCAIHGYFPKKIQYFTNATKLASKVAKRPVTLEVKEQWLENPCWDIYIANEDHEEFYRLYDMLHNKKCDFIPYLGKNDHPLSIEQVELISLEPCEEETVTIHSLFQEEFEIEHVDDVELDERPYFFENLLPIGLHPQTGLYEMEKLKHTNLPIVVEEGTVWLDGEKGLCFL